MKRKFRRNDKIDFIDEFGGHHYKEYTTNQMNDLCPKRFEKCGHPSITNEMMCFGRYKSCQYYKNER